MSGQIIASSSEVALDSSDCWTYTKIGLNSGFGITIICPAYVCTYLNMAICRCNVCACIYVCTCTDAYAHPDVCSHLVLFSSMAPVRQQR